MKKRAIIVKSDRGKSVFLHWSFNDDFLCSLSEKDVKYLISDLCNWLKKNKNKWKRNKVKK